MPALVMMTDARRAPDPVADIRRLPPGAAVIFRHYELAPPERRALARVLRAATLARRIKLLIADDLRLALELRADGVHFSEYAVRRGHLVKRQHVKHRRPGWLVTAAAHSLPALRRAAQAGACAVLLSPVFATLSHPGAPALGSLRFAVLSRMSRLPVYGLGGISECNIRRLRGSNAVGVAAIGALSPGETRPVFGASPDRAVAISLPNP